MSKLLGKTKPGGITGIEEFMVSDIDGIWYVTNIQDILNLVPTPTEFSLTDGSGTTANGSAIDLGGVFTGSNVLISTGVEDDSFEIRSDDPSGAYRHIKFTGGNTSIVLEAATSNANQANLNLSGVSASLTFDDFDGGYGEFGLSGTAVPIIYHHNGVVASSIEVRGDTVYMSGIPTGATQVAAAVAANEFWITTGHATLPDRVAMIGI